MTDVPSRGTRTINNTPYGSVDVGANPAIVPQLASDVAAAEAQMNVDLEDIKYYLVISLAIGYAF